MALSDFDLTMKGLTAKETLKMQEEYARRIAQMKDQLTPIHVLSGATSSNTSSYTNNKLTNFTVEEIDNGYILLAPNTKVYCADGEDLANAVIVFLTKRKMEV